MYGNRVGHLIGCLIEKGTPEDLEFLGSNPRLCTSSPWNESRFNVNAVMRRLEKDMRPWGPTGDPHESSATNLRGRELTPTDCAGSNLYCAVISGLIRKFPSLDLWSNDRVNPGTPLTHSAVPRDSSGAYVAPA